MSNVVVFTSPRSTAVMQAPGRPDKDPVLGSRRRLFADGGPLATLRLLDRMTTTPACCRHLPAHPNRRRARAPEVRTRTR
jgi:hypothetical protein